MRTHVERTPNGRRNHFLVTVGPALVVLVLGGVLVALRLHAQSPSAQSPNIVQWQIDAGGRMAFDVASVKQNKCGLPPTCPLDSNVFLVPGDTYSPTGGLLRVTNWPVLPLIVFAYKLNATDYQPLRSQLPKWANNDRFDIEARSANSNPTKDQMRLMMQTLLADRFKLAVHIETRELPVFALVLDKSGKTGPHLRPHLDDPPCPPVVSSATPSAVPVPDGYPSICGTAGAWPGDKKGQILLGGRNVTMRLIGASLVGQAGRPILDQTGLSGNFDYIIEWVPQPNGTAPPASDVQTDPTGPTFLEALKDQLGLCRGARHRPY
jgi:uncharacterized protein (TIGR03435 family)